MTLFVEGMLNDIRFVFKCAGLSLECRKETRKQTIIRRFIFFINSLMLNSDIIISASWFFIGIRSGISFTELTFVSPCFTFGTITSIKATYLVFNEDLINKIVEDMKVLEVKTLDKTNNIIEKFVNKEAKFLKYIIKIFFRMHGLNIVFFIVSPLALILMNFMKTGEMEFRLPLLDFYTFVQPTTICWIMKYIKQIYSG
ncbi:uncharacterized protein LOC135309871 [Plodia interpunctella]|uniref:uncharacterized protein LOC135309871 n=1 Tax=Plodia interpunctella TaxID=58824 RepID=UPI0031019FB8